MLLNLINYLWFIWLWFGSEHIADAENDDDAILDSSFHLFPTKAQKAYTTVDGASHSVEKSHETISFLTTPMTTTPNTGNGGRGEWILEINF